MRQKFTLSAKKEIPQEAKKTTIRSASLKDKVDRKCARDWIVKENSGMLDEQDGSSFRLSGGGRPVPCAELDELLIEEFRYDRSQHRCVTRNKMVEMADAIVQKLDEKPDLALPNGWLECFLQRHDLVMRKATNKPKLSASAIVARGVNFINNIRELIQKYGIEQKNIINMDETAIICQHSKDRTLEVRGASDVPVKSLGFEKVRVTAVFAAAVDGTKLKPCVMVTGKSLSLSTEPGVAKLTNLKSWMNIEAFIKWVDYMFPFVAPNSLLLVFDSARSHISKKAKAHLHARNILFAVIPGEMTAYLQPCDYGIFKPLKDKIAESIRFTI